VLTLALLPLTAACGDGAPAAQPTVTQTVTLDSAAPEPTAEPEETLGGIRGRAYDAGTVVDVRERPDGGTLLVLDRWTMVGVDDARLAKHGAEVVAHEGARFTNQNAERTYAVPVGADVMVVFNTCVPASEEGVAPGLSSRTGTLEEFLEMPRRDSTVVLLAYDDGELVRLDTDPAC
jgi:hypothetical protein